MKKVTVKAYAKINLTLDVKELKNNFHPIRSIVSSVGIFDKITLVKRKDKKIKLTTSGINPGCSKTQNNAYKTAELFMKTFSTNGVNIYLKKQIPVGAGLGGSSADVAGVLIGMKKLFGLDVDLEPLANVLGSDCNYMLRGGYAYLSGRGEKVRPLLVRKRFPVVIITSSEAVSSKKCYKAFDERGKVSKECSGVALKFLENEDYAGFFAVMKNDLYKSALTFCPSMKDNLTALKESGASVAIMTGSGSAVYGIYKNGFAQGRAYKKLKKKQVGFGIIKTKTKI